MATAALASIVSYCDRLLNTSGTGDYDGAVNGLQMQNSGRVIRVAAAVDASLATIDKAIAQQASLLIVHHGLFWGVSHPWVGKKYELIHRLITHDLAVYSSHLPLDAHPRLGNNALLSAALKLRNYRPFFPSHGQSIGMRGNASFDRDELKLRIHSITGARVHLIPAGPRLCRRIGIVTGGAGGDLKKAANEGIDTFITGEGPHWTFALAEELGVNVFYAGHYATETFGVKALAAEISRKFKVPWCFVDHPTGL